MTKRSLILASITTLVSAPLFAYAATSAGYNLTQEGIEQNQYEANTASYIFQAEIGAPTAAPTVSTNYQYDHGASWFSTGPGSTPTPVTPTSTQPPQAGAQAETTTQSLNQTSFQIIQINEHAILVSWISNQPGFGRVVYGLKSADTLSSGPTYGYPFMTPVLTDASTYQAVVIDNLEAGKLYHFRPVSRVNGSEIIGPELKIELLQKTGATPLVTEPTSETGEPRNPITPPKQPATPGSKPVLTTTPPKPPSPSTPTSSPAITTSKPFVTSIRQNSAGQYVLTGTAKPGSTIRIIVY